MAFNFSTENVTFSNATTAEPPRVGSGTTPLEEKLLNIQSVLNLVLLIIVLLSVGASTSWKEVLKQIKRPIGIVIACCIEFILMPFIAYGLPRLIKLPATYQLGLYIVSCSPGGALSNLFTLASRGCVPLSITMTTTATILSVGVLPLHLLIYSKLTSAMDGAIAIPFENVLITLACIILPATLGMCIHYKSERIALKISRVCGLIGFALILVALGIRIYLNVDLYLSASWEPLFIAGIIPAIGMTVAFILTSIFRMPCYERRTVSLETGGQNFTLALTLISLSFPPSLRLQEMLVMPSFYAFFSTLEIIFLVPIIRIYSRYHFCGPCEKEKKLEDNDELSLTYQVAYSEGGVSNSAIGIVDESNFQQNTNTQTDDDIETANTLDLDAHL